MKSIISSNYPNRKEIFQSEVQFVRPKMSIKGINMFPKMKNIRLKKKILIILDFENGFLPTYLRLCSLFWGMLNFEKMHIQRHLWTSLFSKQCLLRNDCGIFFCIVNACIWTLQRSVVLRGFIENSCNQRPDLLMKRP